MKLSQFKFAFSESLIAKHPSDNRDEAKLMVVNREKGKIESIDIKGIDCINEGFGVD